VDRIDGVHGVLVLVRPLRCLHQQLLPVSFFSPPPHPERIVSPVSTSVRVPKTLVIHVIVALPTSTEGALILVANMAGIDEGAAACETICVAWKMQILSTHDVGLWRLCADLQEVATIAGVLLVLQLILQL